MGTYRQRRVGAGAVFAAAIALGLGMAISASGALRPASASASHGSEARPATSTPRPAPTWLFRAVHEEPASLTDPTTGLTSHTVYRPADLNAVPFKMPIMIWGNGGCRVSSREFSYFLHQ